MIILASFCTNCRGILTGSIESWASSRESYVFVHSASMVECADIGIKILFVQILYRNTKKKLVKLHEVNVWNCSETTWSKNYPGFNSQNVKNIVNRRKFKPVNFFSKQSKQETKKYLGLQILNRQPIFFCFLDLTIF